MRMGEKIIYIRNKKGISQGDLANYLEVSRQAISRWELGISVPEYKHLVKLTELFNVSFDYLMDENIEDEQTTIFDNDLLFNRKGLEKRDLFWFSMCLMSSIIISSLIIVSFIYSHGIDKEFYDFEFLGISGWLFYFHGNFSYWIWRIIFVILIGLIILSLIKIRRRKK